MGTRRDFLVTSAGLTAAVASGCWPFRSKSATIDDPMPNSDALIDVHCHNFNGADLPVQGFLQRVWLPDEFGGASELLGLLALALKRFAATCAPGYQEEKTRLDALLGRKLELAALANEAQVDRKPVPSLDEFLRDVRQTHPREYEGLVRYEMRRRGLPPGARVPRRPAVETVRTFEAYRIVKRFWDWLWGVMCQYRYVVASLFLEEHHEVVLGTPALVDFDYWVDDHPETSIPEQIDLWERIVRLYKGRLHPFVAYDPLREIRNDTPEQQSFYWVKQAVATRGFVGVKLYPPMGFRAIGNDGRPGDEDVTAAEYTQLDAALNDLFTWCVQEDVPILAHSNLTNATSEERKDCAHARHWRKVMELEPYAGLRLNLGHFGDVAVTGTDSQTSAIISLMTAQHPNIYADVAYHEGGLRRDEKARDDYFRALGTLVGTNPVVRSRLLYGSDWHMINTQEGFEDYPRTYMAGLRSTLPGDVTAVGRLNALRFLGLDGFDTKIRRRLLAFYRKYEMHDRPRWWVGDW